MAYQNIQITHGSDRLHRIFDGLKSVFSAIGHGMMSVANANRRMLMVEKLQAKSDAELAKMGIRREDIVRHVFRDMLDA